MSTTTTETTSLEQVNARASRSIYSALSPGEIRTVTLRLGGSHDAIQCNLRTVQMEANETKYEALSYVWGAQSNPVSILLEGRTFWITRNLGIALQHIRSPAEDRVLWIDALCINQSDNPERSSQVRHMHNIYDYADTTLIWLGPAENSSDMAMQYLSDFQSNDCSNTFILNDVDFIPHFFSILQLYQREYWSRLWVMQELYFSKRPVLMCGRRCVDFHPTIPTFVGATLTLDFVRKMENVLASRGNITKSGFVTYFLNTQGPARMVKTQIREPSRFAFALAEWVRNKHCSDARDTIFGIYNMLPTEIAKMIVVDYVSDTAQVLTEASRVFLTTTRCLDLISWPKSTPGQGLQIAGEVRLPSWVLDMSSCDLAMPFHWLYKPLQPYYGIDTVSAPKFHIDGRVLNVSGFCAGQISHVQQGSWTSNQILDTKPPSLLALEEIWSWLLSCWSVVIAAGIDSTQYLTSFFETIGQGRLSYGLILARLRTNFETGGGERTFIRQGDTSETVKEALGWLSELYVSLASRAFFLFDCTEFSEPRFGIASMFAKVGDLVCLLDDCHPAVVLHPADAGHYYVVGDVFAEEFLEEDEPRSLRDYMPDSSRWEEFRIR